MLCIPIVSLLLNFHFQWGLKKHAQSSDQQSLRILFIGNSFTFTHGVVDKFVSMLRKSGKENLVIESYAIPNFWLRQHMKRSNLKKALARHWDYVIVQEHSGAPLVDAGAFHDAVEKIVPLIKAAGAKPVLIMTWADRGCISDQRSTSLAYRKIGREFSLPVVPVGDLFFLTQEKYPAISLYQKDDHHPDLAGAYLYALALFSELYPSEPLPVLADEKSGSSLPPKVAEQLADVMRDWKESASRRPEFFDETVN